MKTRTFLLEQARSESFKSESHYFIHLSQLVNQSSSLSESQQETFKRLMGYRLFQNKTIEETELFTIATYLNSCHQ